MTFWEDGEGGTFSVFNGSQPAQPEAASPANSAIAAQPLTPSYQTDTQAGIYAAWGNSYLNGEKLYPSVPALPFGEPWTSSFNNQAALNGLYSPGFVSPKNELPPGVAYSIFDPLTGKTEYSYGNVTSDSPNPNLLNNMIQGSVQSAVRGPLSTASSFVPYIGAITSTFTPGESLAFKPITASEIRLPLGSTPDASTSVPSASLSSRNSILGNISSAVSRNLSGSLGSLSNSLVEGSRTGLPGPIQQAATQLGGAEVARQLGVPLGVVFDVNSPNASARESSLRTLLNRLPSVSKLPNGAAGAIGSVLSNVIGSVGSSGSGQKPLTSPSLGNAVSNVLSANSINGQPLSPQAVAGEFGSTNPSWKLSDNPQVLSPFTSGVSLTSNRDPNNEPNVLTKSSALLSALNRGDPVMSYEWVALIVDPANPLTIEPIYIESITAPTITFDQKMRFADGANLAYTGALSVGQMSITLMADAYGKAFKLANNWIFSIYDQESGGFYAPKDYKKSVKLFVHDAKKGVIVQFDYLGVWPVSWEGHSWDQSSTPAPVRLTLSVDRVRVSGSAYWTDL